MKLISFSFVLIAISSEVLSESTKRKAAKAIYGPDGEFSLEERIPTTDDNFPNYLSPLPSHILSSERPPHVFHYPEETVNADPEVSNDEEKEADPDQDEATEAGEDGDYIEIDSIDTGPNAESNSSSTKDDPAENPLDFLNLAGTDFQPGRLVNIFFGLIIMIFMIVIHGYVLWVVGIAYLPGTRSLNDWKLNEEALNNLTEMVLHVVESLNFENGTLTSENSRLK